MITYHPDIFPFNIAIVEANEVKDLYEFTDSEGEKIQVNNGISGMVVKAMRRDKETGTSTAYSMIVFRGIPTVNTIAHEAFHSACDLLENIGIDYIPTNCEIFAYTIGYIAGCINDALHKDSVWEVDKNEKGSAG